MTRTARSILVVAALTIGATPIVPIASAAHARPFKARLAGNAHLRETEDPCVMRNDETGTGQATYLGRFTWADIEFVNFCTNPGGVAVVATFTMTAANGDELHGELTTTGSPNADGNLVIHGTYELIGGTGRFANATGSGDIDALAFLSPGLPFEGSLRGTIEY